MAPKKKHKKDKTKHPKKSNVDIDKLKSYGIIKDDCKDKIDEIDGNDISGGKEDGETTVDTQWPTTLPGAL